LPPKTPPEACPLPRLIREIQGRLWPWPYVQSPGHCRLLACFDIAIELRYTVRMTRQLLPPHLEQLVRQQLATGRFQSESDVIRAALHLLEEESLSREATAAWLKQEIDKGVNSKPSEPITKEYWAGLRDYLHAQHGPDDAG
jgi:putative addiction module CopG family antidote